MNNENNECKLPDRHLHNTPNIVDLLLVVYEKRDQATKGLTNISWYLY